MMAPSKKILSQENLSILPSTLIHMITSLICHFAIKNNFENEVGMVKHKIESIEESWDNKQPGKNQFVEYGTVVVDSKGEVERVE